MNDFSAITQVIVPTELAHRTQVFLRKVGETRREGMVLWVGIPESETFRVTAMLIPKQRGIRTKDGICVIVDADEMHRINVELFKSKLRLIAQIHSHPTDAYHSETDDSYAIATTVGSLSLVVPDFAAAEFNLSDCAVYRLKENGEWDHIPLNKVRKLIILER